MFCSLIFRIQKSIRPESVHSLLLAEIDPQQLKLIYIKKKKKKKKKRKKRSSSSKHNIILTYCAYIHTGFQAMDNYPSEIVCCVQYGDGIMHFKEL